jgi:hypothetical protein
MSRDNRTEIEEIVQDVDKAIRANFAWDVLASGYIVSSADNIAQELYYKGYRKSTDLAEEIFAEIEKRLSMYSHIHNYAEEAKKVTEEFADGTPCEMSSVWDAIALHKNGWDDYETMCQLQENIQNIDKSRLLKEFEGDIAELKKKYTESEDTE